MQKHLFRKKGGIQRPSKTANEYTYDVIKVGHRSEFHVRVDRKLVRSFAELSGDYSPLHVDPKFARKTEFRAPIAHGMIAGMLFSRLIGMELPGKFAVYLSQRLSFHRPIRYGQLVAASGVVKEKSDATKSVIIITELRDKKTKEVLVRGEALVKISA